MDTETEQEVLRLLIGSHKAKHFAIFIISIFFVFLSSSVFFIKSSIQHQMIENLKNHSDFIVQNTNGAKIEDIQTSLINEIKQINGVKNVSQRVFGTYFFAPENILLISVILDTFPLALIATVPVPLKLTQALQA